MMFTEHPFLERFQAARMAGFKAVEFLFPYDHAPEEIAERLQANDLAVSVFNLPPGDWSAGERGIAAIPGREKDFLASVGHALRFAKPLGADRLHIMAGLVDAAKLPEARRTYISNLRIAADLLADVGLIGLVEPINPRDMPGYLLSSADEALAIISDLGRENIYLQFDIYHHQIVRGDVCRSLERFMPVIGHVQIAGVPERHEPDTGELDYRKIFSVLDRLDYHGWVGCEYRPANDTVAGLGWLEAF